MGRTGAYTFCILAALAVGCPDPPGPDFRVPYPNADTIGFAAVDVCIVAKGDGMLWKNGRAESLRVGADKFSGAGAVFASGGDVYVAGHEIERYTQNYQTMERCYAAIWKNGAMERIGGADTQALSVFVSDGTVYAAGVTSKAYPAAPGAMLWVDGAATLLGGAGAGARANSVFVSDGDVYVAGQEDGAATLWVNGSATRLPDGGGGATALSVFVSGPDVYVAGKEGAIHTHAVLWVNGERTRLGDGDHSQSKSSADSVTVSGGDIYVAGRNDYLPALWRNGAERRLENREHRLGGANSVAVFGGDVYAVGWLQGWPILWKNGAAHWIEWTHGQDDAEPISVSVAAAPARP